MSIGQRIAQKRKEFGLSQEALGEQMGVSRQAIYKWESDATLPEIEKLVALSKLFGVSVGWLLGVEEDTAPEQTGSDTLTQEQLEMVEEIVRRYIEAQPKPKPRRKWPWVLAACVLVVVFIQLFSRMDQLNNQYKNLQNSVGNISSSVNSQVNSIASRVEEILMAQNRLVAEYKTELADTDYRNGMVTIFMEAVPKTYIQGMGAVFVVDYGNGPKEFESILHDTHSFSAEAQVPLTDSITVSVVFVSADGTRYTQVLDTYSGFLSDSYADLNIGENDLMRAEMTDGKFSLDNWYVIVWGSTTGKGGAEITECQMGVFRNQELIGWAEPCEQPSGYIGDYSAGQFYKMPALQLEDLTEGETIEVAALVTDSYGRQYMVCDIPYEVSCRSGDQMWFNWPSVVQYDRDPAQWTFE